MFGGERHEELTVLRRYRDDAVERDVDVQEHELGTPARDQPVPKHPRSR